MNNRVKAYRERQKAAGLSQVSLWLDGPTATLLKQATATQQRLPGEIIGMALQEWWVNRAPMAPNSATTATEKPADPPPTATADPALLRELVRQLVKEELAASSPEGGMKTKQPDNPLAETTTEPIEALAETTDKPVVEPVQAAVEITDQPVVEPVQAAVEITEKPAVEPVQAAVEITEKPAVEPAKEAVEITDQPAVEPAKEAVEITDKPAAGLVKKSAEKTAEQNHSPLPRPSLYNWPMSF